MTNATIAADRIINAAYRAFINNCVSCPDVMMECYLDEAQELVNEEGYAWDVALIKATSIYPCLKYVPQNAGAYSKEEPQGGTFLDH